MAAPFDKSGIIEFFLIEAGEHLQNLNRGLLSLEKDPADTAMIDELFRAAHTLKGSAAMMGFQGISDVAHKSEDMLGMFRAGAAEIRKETLDFLFDSVDAIKLMVDGVAAGQPEDPLIVETILRAYEGVAASVQQAAHPAQQAAERKDDIERAWEQAFGAGAAGPAQPPQALQGAVQKPPAPAPPPALSTAAE